MSIATVFLQIDKVADIKSFKNNKIIIIKEKALKTCMLINPFLRGNRIFSWATQNQDDIPSFPCNWEWAYE